MPSTPPSRRGFLASVAAASLAGCTRLRGSSPCPLGTAGDVDGWPLPDRDPRNSRAVDTQVDVGGLSTAWTVSVRRRLGPPVVADGTVFVVSPRVDTDEVQSEEPPPAILAFDAATGEPAWRRDVRYDRDPGQAVLERRLAAGHGAAYVVQRTLDDRVKDRLVAFDAGSGERRWTREGVRAAPPHRGGGVVISTRDRAMLAVDPRDGAVCTRAHVQSPLARLLGGWRVEPRPAVVDETAYVASVEPHRDDGPWRFRLHALELASGERAWTAGPYTSPVTPPSTVTADDRHVYLPHDHRLRAFTHDGEPVWTRPLVDPEPYSRPSLVGTVATDGDGVVATVVGSDSADGLYGLDAADGRRRWHRGDLSGAPVVAGGSVVASRPVEVSPDEYVAAVVAVDLRTGETLSERRLPGGIAHPLIVADGQVLVVEADRPDPPAARRPTYRLRALA